MGLSLGAGIGALLLELSGGREVQASLRSGIGAFVGQITGSLTKILIGVFIWLIAGIATFWP